MPDDAPAASEWLEADGRGGFASGPAHGPRTRRYHALLLTAQPPPGDRMVLVADVEAWVEQAGQRIALTSQRYAPDITTQGATATFDPAPWPSWRAELPGGVTVVHELLVDPESGDTVLRWRGLAPDMSLHVRPLLATRNYHALQQENPACDVSPQIAGGNAAWRPYAGQPATACLTNGTYRHDPCWYRHFFYTEECRRGLDCTEDLVSPGVFSYASGSADPVMILRAGDGISARAAPLAARILETRARRTSSNDALAAAVRAYLIERPADGGCGLIAGYPWFGEWGRDTFIALRGLLLGTGRVAEAQAVLLAWAGLVSEGMLPNRLADGGTPEYNSVDASLWYIVAVHDVLAAQANVPDAVRARLRDACEAILQGYANGTRYRIAADTDGLLRAGEPGRQLTWMDAKVGDWVVTPRIGKPVEVQALWHSALRIGGAWNARWTALADRASSSFSRTFANPEGGLFDVIDVDHTPGNSNSPCVRTRSLPSAAYPSPCWTAPPPARWSIWWRRSF